MRCLVLGASGFLGGYMERRLKLDGHFVVSASRTYPRFVVSTADEFSLIDLTYLFALRPLLERFAFDEIYNFAAEVGGVGYINDDRNDADILRNSFLINLNLLEEVRRLPVEKWPRVFFASSQCVYPRTRITQCAADFSEADAYPAEPDTAFGWEKLTAERLYDAYRRNYGVDIRIARFGNTYGPNCTWQGPRAKAPAALCRKVAQAFPGQDIEIWGHGGQTRSFTWVEDAIEGAVRLMASDCPEPVNIASSERVSIRDLVKLICKVASKPPYLRQVPGPIGVDDRGSDNTFAIEKLGWEPATPLEQGIGRLYAWVADQMALTMTTH